MTAPAPTNTWCSAALAALVWERSPALAWLLDVPTPALFREGAEQWNHLHERGET